MGSGSTKRLMALCSPGMAYCPSGLRMSDATCTLLGNYDSHVVTCVMPCFKLPWAQLQVRLLELEVSLHGSK